MPQATDLVINNGAGTPVAKTFTLLTPAAGDGGTAEWALKEGTIGSVFPRITSSAHRTGNASRQARIKLRIPSSYTDTVTGLTKVGSAFEFNGTFSVPDDFPEALKNDAVAYSSNLFDQTLIKAIIRDALPAN
jgi:hypothetical protein